MRKDHRGSKTNQTGISVLAFHTGRLYTQMPPFVPALVLDFVHSENPRCGSTSSACLGSKTPFSRKSENSGSSNALFPHVTHLPSGPTVLRVSFCGGSLSPLILLAVWF